MTDSDPPAHDGHGDAAPPPSDDTPPRLIAGGRAVSLAGLLERIEAELEAEIGGRTDLLTRDALPDEPARREMIRDVVDYVLNVESVSVPRAERLALLDAVYDEVFNLGPLRAYLDDEHVTEIVINSYDRLYVRRDGGSLHGAPSGFGDAAHLERVAGRVLASAGARLTTDEPLQEVGVKLAGRPARVTVTGAPISPALHVEIRLHPANPAALADLVGRGMLDDEAATLLRRFLEAGRGLMIAGDAGAGKTTLLQALLPLAPGQGMSVERAAELQPPPGWRQVAPIPARVDVPAVDFAAQILAALEEKPAWLALDEVRFDESAAMWAALSAAPGPRCLWAFRASTDPIRLRTAFSMAIRRAVQTLDQALIHDALVSRLPGVAFMAHRQGRAQVTQLGEWVPAGGGVALRALWGR
ncbi:MAG: Flp pilus assembly complex ATPase component TadA [Anaerolineae bacterium]|nr:Flp pilus assembly complex ATPase component TadA [Anaerolineae bacterium]